MDDSQLSAIGLVQQENYKKSGEYTYEVRVALYHKDSGDLVAAFSTVTRPVNGEQTLNTHTQFIQRHYLTLRQIECISEWLRSCAIAARWRLTSFTTIVETHL